MKNKLKIIFFGSSNFSLSILENIYNFNKLDLLCIITKENNLNLIKSFSIKNNINLFKPKNLDINIINVIKKLNPDLIIIVSYGKLIPKEIINIPKLGCINLHCSLLPKWKGPFPIYWTILSGDKISGITIIKINSKLDSGNIILQKKIKISQRENYITLENKLIKVGYESIINLLYKFINNIKIHEIIQIDTKNKYANKINKKIDTKINWELSSIDIDRHIRASLLYGSYFYYKKNIIKIWESDILTYKKIFIK